MRVREEICSCRGSSWRVAKEGEDAHGVFDARRCGDVDEMKSDLSWGLEFHKVPVSLIISQHRAISTTNALTTTAKGAFSWRPGALMMKREMSTTYVERWRQRPISTTPTRISKPLHRSQILRQRHYGRNISVSQVSSSARFHIGGAQLHSLCRRTRNRWAWCRSSSLDLHLCFLASAT
jgi:hypothetical protein